MKEADALASVVSRKHCLILRLQNEDELSHTYLSCYLPLDVFRRKQRQSHALEMIQSE